MTRSLPLLVVTLTLVAGCSFLVDVVRNPNAPVLPPSPYAEVVHKPPTGAIELGRLDAHGNSWQSASDCEARMVIEGRELGANVVFVQPEATGFAQNGPHCSAVAFFVQPPK